MFAWIDYAETIRSWSTQAGCSGDDFSARVGRGGRIRKTENGEVKRNRETRVGESGVFCFLFRFRKKTGKAVAYGKTAGNGGGNR